MYSFNLVHNLIVNILVAMIENDFCIIQLTAKKTKNGKLGL